MNQPGRQHGDTSVGGMNRRQFLASTAALSASALLPRELPGAPSQPPPSSTRHPRVLINESELAALRRQVAQPGWKRDLYRTPRQFAMMNPGHGVRANADLWLSRKIEIPAHGGHYHHFFCTDGERLEIPKDQRFAPPPYRCPVCGKEYTGEKYEAAMRRLLHGWLAQAALDLALVGAIEQNPAYSAKSAEILSRYAAAYPGPHTSTVAGGMIYQSLDESMWVIPLAQAYDLVYSSVSPPDRAKIETFLRTAAKGIQSCGTPGNWGSWHLSAVGVVGYAIGDQELVGWATERFQRQIRSDLGDDGLWPESVHTYHYFPLLAFMYFAEAAWHAGVDLYHWEAAPGKSLLTMFIAPLRYAYPDLRLAAINDGWFQAFVPADFYELAFHRTQDPRFAWVLTQGYRPGVMPAGLVPSSGGTPRRDGFFAFLFGDGIPLQTTPPPATSINFPVLGIAVLRSPRGAVMTFDYGKFLGHGHKDKMGITLFANDQLWAADYGTPGYGSEIVSWYQSTFAHNTIIVDGKGQNPTKENAATLWLADPKLEAVRSETSDAYPGVSHTRTVLRIGDYFVVRDQLSSQEEHTYDFYLHSEGEFSLKGSSADTRPVTSPTRWIEGLSALPPTHKIFGQWANAKSGLAFTLLGRSPVTPILGKCPAETGSRQVPLLIARQTGTTAEFISVLFPYRDTYSLDAEWTGEQLRIRHNRREDVITLPVGQTPPLLVEHSTRAAGL